MYTSDIDRQLFSKIDDGIELCCIRQKPYFIFFMSERKQYIAQQYLKSVGFDNYTFFGGYENSERKMLGLFFNDKDIKCFPIYAIEFSFRNCDKLNHRDFLGALMSLGLERDTIGDILIEDGRCIVFVREELKDYITSQVFKIGNVGVKVNIADLSKLPQGRGMIENNYVVSSLRLDNIVAAVCKISREKTRSMILSGNVCVNYSEVKNVSFNLKPDDIFTIRGKGKFILSGILGNTGKGRLRISVIYFR